MGRVCVRGSCQEAISLRGQPAPAAAGRPPGHARPRPRADGRAGGGWPSKCPSCPAVVDYRNWIQKQDTCASDEGGGWGLQAHGIAQQRQGVMEKEKGAADVRRAP